MEVSRKLGKMVNYRELFFDSTRQLYFRLVTQNGRFDADNKLLGDEVWLQSYDLDLKLTGEQPFKDITWTPINPFLKDGKLYDLTFLEEDPGFVVWDFNFSSD